MYKKGKVHPSPPLPGDPLSLLPVTILALAAALSADDKKILAYLISCSSRNTNPDTHRKRAQKKNTVDYHGDNGGGGGCGAEHEPVFECNCFNCYLSYWARWDNSPNRQVIDEIIEAYEEWLLKKEKKSSKKKKEKSLKKKEKAKPELKGNRERDFVEEVKVDKGFEIGKFELVENDPISATEDVELELEKSTVRKISSFVGQKIWGFWGK